MTGCNVALDETLDETLRLGGLAGLDDLLQRLPVKALVIKPSAIGGFGISVSVAKLASTHGIQVGFIRSPLRKS